MVLSRYVTALYRFRVLLGHFFFSRVVAWPLSDDLHYGLALTQNPNQTSFAKQQLTGASHEENQNDGNLIMDHHIALCVRVRLE